MTTTAGGGGRRRSAGLVEALALLASPVVAVYALHLRVMAPSDEPDMSISTALYVVPRDIFSRYTALFSPTARLREAARVGFLVPARLDYLAFGAVPGFFVTRYLFVLAAVVPVYLLLRRLYGMGAGAVGVLVFLTCPVVLTAWGTDYQDSAVVSYMAGALACLAMPCIERRRRWWVGAAAALATLGVWAHGIGALLAVSTLAAYLAVGLVRRRDRMVGDFALMAAVFLAVTGLLSVASELLLGHFDFIEPTWAAFRYLNQPSQIVMWHSANWRWAPYVAYLLVPPAVVAAFAVTFGRRLRGLAGLPTAVLLVGTATAFDVLAFWIMQFFGNLQTLEMHLFSSTLWSSVLVALALVIAELTKPLLEHRFWQWAPAAALVVIVLVYEIHPHIPAFGWLPYGFVVAAVLIASAAAGRFAAARVKHWAARAGAGIVAAAAVVTCATVLTVAAVPVHAKIPGTALNTDPNPAYASALGGSASDYVDQFTVTAELPLWVGHPSFPGEVLVTWWPFPDVASLNGPIGVFHSGFTSLPTGVPVMGAVNLGYIGARHAAQVLMFSPTGDGFAAGVAGLAPYDPKVVKRGVLSAGSVHLHVWLVDLLRNFPGKAT